MRTLLLLLGLIAIAVVALGAEVKTTVKYIAADAVYIDAGKLEGVQNGDRVDIRRKDKLIAVMEVIFVSDHSASCKLLENTGTIEVGDDAVVQVTELETPTTETKQEVAPNASPAAPQGRARSVREDRWTGRIGAEMYVEDDLETTNNDVAQPSLNVNSSLLNIGGSAYMFSVNMRLRRINRERHTAYPTESHWNNRIYEAALTYDNPESNWGFSAGRVARNAIAGIGTIDGLLISRKIAPRWSVGAFGGTQPDLENTDFRSDEVKTGAFAEYKTARERRTAYRGTLAFAGDYRSGEINREFFYQQSQLNRGSRFYLYESSEINLNRDWQKDAAGTTFTWSSFLLNSWYSPTKSVSFELGYDNRRSFRTWETRTLADSLFDDATRQGLRAGINTRFARNWHVGAQGNLRARRSDFSAGQSVSLNAGTLDLASSGVFSEARFTVYENDFSRGNQPSLRLQRNVMRSVSASFDVGVDHYELKASNETADANWLRLGADARFTQHVYGSVSGEVRRGADADSNHLLAELGYRF